MLNNDQMHLPLNANDTVLTRSRRSYDTLFWVSQCLGLFPLVLVTLAEKEVVRLTATGEFSISHCRLSFVMSTSFSALVFYFGTIPCFTFISMIGLALFNVILNTIYYNLRTLMISRRALLDLAFILAFGNMCMLASMADFDAFITESLLIGVVVVMSFFFAGMYDDIFIDRMPNYITIQLILVLVVAIAS